MMIWNTAGTLVYVALQWMVTILVTKINGYEAAGVFAIAMSCAGIFYSFSLFGVRQFQVTDLQKQYTDGVYLGHRLIFCALAFLLGAIYAFFFLHEKLLILCTVLFLIFKMGESLIDVLQGIQQKNWRMDITGASYIIRGLFALIVFVFVLKGTHSLPLAILGMAIVTFLVMLIYDIPQTRRLANFQVDFNRDSLTKLTMECLPLMFYILTTYIIPYVPREVAKTILGSEMLGVYVSIATPLLIVQLAAILFFNPLMPLFTQYHQDKKYTEFYKLLVLCGSVIILITAAGIFASKYFGELILNILFDKVAGNHAYLLYPIVVCSTMTAASSLLTYILISIRKLKEIVFSSIAGCVSIVIASRFFLTKFSLNGISYSVLFALGIECFIMILVLTRTLYKETHSKEGTT